MIKQAFQHAELRDANDTIIQQGAYGKMSPLANSTNDAWIDFVMNNLEVLYDDFEDISEDLTVEDLTAEDLTITGTGTAPTVAANDNSTNIATTAYADRSSANAAAAIVGSAPGTLDTLAELAAALGDDPNFATTIVTLIDTKCAQAKAEAMLAAHPVGSFYESTDSTSPATLFGGTWQEQIPDGELVGSVTAFAGNTLPEGWLLCNGSAVSRETYAALYSVIGGTYGAGDGSTTFNLPNLTDRFIQGNATSGTVKSAGLPNITNNNVWSSNVCGVKLDKTVATDTWAGAIGTSGSYSSTVASDPSSARGFSPLLFDASRSNSIYGNSNTVQPPALTMRYAIYSGVVNKKLWLRTI